MTIGARELAAGDHLVEAQPGEVPLLVAEPADARRQALEVHLLAGLGDPAAQVLVLGEQLEDRAVGRGDVGRVAGERGPAERPLALGEERPDVRGHEPGEVEGALVAAELRLGADRVAVVEDLGARILEPDHGLDVLRHRRRAPRSVNASGSAAARVVPLVDRDALGQVAERVVRAGLVGDDVDRDAAGEQLGEHRRRVADEADGERRGAPPWRRAPARPRRRGRR